MSGDRLPKHLTDDQFGDLLVGERPSAAVEEHLAVCEHCRGELVAVQGSLSNFNVFSLTWAQRESARRVQTPSRWALQLANLPPWAIGLAGAGAAFLVAMGLGMPILHEPEPVATAKIVIPVPSEAEIARDNQLLASIDQELNYTAQLAVPEDQLRISTGTEQRRSIGLLVSN